MKFNRRLVLLIILILAVITIFLPIKVDYSFDAIALVYPISEWNLKRGQDDSFISELQNNETNVISNLLSYKFERGDVAEVHIRKDIVSGDWISNKDTLAVIHSFFIDNEIARLQDLKQVEKKALNVTVTGEKQALIDQYTREVEYANKQLDLTQKNYERQKKLYFDSVVSQSEFEVYENEFHLAKINVEIAEKELVSVQTGAKAEEIDYIKQKIDSYEREIQILEEMKRQYFIKSPVSGIISFNRVVDGIMTISDTSRYILKIPIRINNVQYVNCISGIEFIIPGNTEKVDASFVCLDENVTMNVSTKQQHVIAKALIKQGVHGLFPGMAVSCQVYCDKVTIFEFLKRSINFRVY